MLMKSFLTSASFRAWLIHCWLHLTSTKSVPEGHIWSCANDLLFWRPGGVLVGKASKSPSKQYSACDAFQIKKWLLHALQHAWFLLHKAQLYAANHDRIMTSSCPSCTRGHPKLGTGWDCHWLGTGWALQSAAASLARSIFHQEHAKLCHWNLEEEKNQLSSFAARKRQAVKPHPTVLRVLQVWSFVFGDNSQMPFRVI